MDLECRFLIGKYSMQYQTWEWRKLEQDSDFNFTEVGYGQTRTRYRKFVGLESSGKPKNVYTETYAEAATERVYTTYGGGVKHEAFTVELDIVFLGHGRQTAKDELIAYFESGDGITVWWDNIRQKCAILLFDSSVEPEEDRYVSSTPFVETVFKFKSLTGFHPKITVTWTNIDNIPTSNIEAYAQPLVIESLS